MKPEPRHPFPIPTDRLSGLKGQVSLSLIKEGKEELNGTGTPILYGLHTHRYKRACNTMEVNRLPFYHHQGSRCRERERDLKGSQDPSPTQWEMETDVLNPREMQMQKKREVEPEPGQGK
jgi:hypothetical protein